MRIEQKSVVKVLSTEPGIENVFNKCLLLFSPVCWPVQNNAHDFEEKCYCLFGALAIQGYRSNQ